MAALRLKASTTAFWKPQVSLRIFKHSAQLRESTTVMICEVCGEKKQLKRKLGRKTKRHLLCMLKSNRTQEKSNTPIWFLVFSSHTGNL